MKIQEAREIAQGYSVLPQIGEGLYQKTLDYLTCRSDYWWDSQSIAERYHPGNKTWKIINALVDRECGKTLSTVPGMPPEFVQDLETFDGDWDDSYRQFLDKYAADCPCKNIDLVDDEIQQQVRREINSGVIPDGLAVKAQECEAAAIALGFPEEAGRELFLGWLQDRSQKWSEDKFLAWACWMDNRFGMGTSALYREVAQIITA